MFGKNNGRTRIEEATQPSPFRDPDLSSEETDYRPVSWKKVFLTPKYIPWHLLGIAILVLTVLLTVYHDQVVEHLRPFSETISRLPAGWLIPIVIMIIISFPPLFGHELIALLCGVVYGLWIGFGIVAAGTFIGEIGTWFAFRYFLRRKAIKLERTNLNYGALARLAREGGFKIVLAIRFSIVPSHLSTAVFSTCDVRFWHFVVATFLTLPKQIILVYFGVLLVDRQAQEGPGGQAKLVAILVTALVTVVLGVYIWYRMRAIKTVLLEEQSWRRSERELNSIKEAERAFAPLD